MCLPVAYDRAGRVIGASSSQRRAGEHSEITVTQRSK